MSKFYVTTSIAYTNAPPHIGFAQELLAADVVARSKREQSFDVFYLTGTDEHGTKIAQAAKNAGKSAEEFVDELSNQFQVLTKELNISNDDFIRTTEERHITQATDLWKKASKTIEKRPYTGYYCSGCEMYVSEKDIEDGACAIHKKTCEKVTEENYFFPLSNYTGHIKNYFEKNPDFVQPESRKNEILSLLNEGLQDISVSRPVEKLSWGVPVPGDPSQTMYVWFDALSNYLLPLNYWPADLHIIGKDILRFHAALWPAMLMAAQMPLPKQIYVHGFITVDGQKMSKSLGNVISPFDLIKRYGVDATRYLLLRELSFDEDGNFSWKKFDARYNADLANDLGNLTQRVLTLAAKYNIEFKELKDKNSKLAKKINAQINQLKFQDALTEIWQLITLGNQYIDQEKPWALTSDREKLEDVIGDLLGTIDIIATLIKPFMPTTSVKIIEQIKSLKPEPLFPRLI